MTDNVRLKIEEEQKQQQHLGKRGRDDEDAVVEEKQQASSSPSPKRHKATPKGFFDAQGGVAIMLFDEETGSDKVAWYVVPQDVFCAGIEPIAKKFGPTIGRSTNNMFEYLAEVTEVFPYPPEENQCSDSDEEDEDEEDEDEGEEEEEQHDDDEDVEEEEDDGEEKEEKESKGAVGVKDDESKGDKYCPDCYKKQESAALQKLIEHDWAKYIIPNTNPALSLPLPACKVRIYNALYTYSLAVNEHDDDEDDD